jgi:hypothetical protein
MPGNDCGSDCNLMLYYSTISMTRRKLLVFNTKTYYLYYTIYYYVSSALRRTLKEHRLTIDVIPTAAWILQTWDQPPAASFVLVFNTKTYYLYYTIYYYVSSALRRTLKEHRLTIDVIPTAAWILQTWDQPPAASFVRGVVLLDAVE